MASYQIFAFDEAGKVRAGFRIYVADDEVATAFAEVVLGNEAHYEVWQGKRRLNAVGGVPTGEALHVLPQPQLRPPGSAKPRMPAGS